MPCRVQDHVFFQGKKSMVAIHRPFILNAHDTIPVSRENMSNMTRFYSRFLLTFFISKYLTHSRFLFNFLLNNKVRTVRNINAIPFTSAKNVHTNRPHGNMIFADIAMLDLLFLNDKLIMNKPIKQLQIFWATITEK